MRDDERRGYSARADYRDPSVAENYEKNRYSSVLGAYRYRREQVAVRSLLTKLDDHQAVLDCPVGIGRWSEILIALGHGVVALDVSRTMVLAARSRVQLGGGVVGEIEQLPFQDDAFDYSFCHALMKHLPVPLQGRGLRELARVSRRGVICSFNILEGLQGWLWRRRQISEAYGVSWEELRSLSSAAQLRIVEAHRCTTPIGVEHTILFERVR